MTEDSRSSFLTTAHKATQDCLNRDQTSTLLLAEMTEIGRKPCKIENIHFNLKIFLHHDYFLEQTIMKQERNPKTHTTQMDTELETMGETSDMKTSMTMTLILEQEEQEIRTGWM